ncbi:MAG: carboxyltransferase domain-containing protein, partial [Clostridia bacterium]|nr:carboxyltransferase domain-containing protein [Clostridia bacterium]
GAGAGAGAGEAPPAIAPAVPGCLPFGDRAWLFRGTAARALLPHLAAAPPFIAGYAASASELVVEFDPRAAAPAARWLERQFAESAGGAAGRGPAAAGPSPRDAAHPGPEPAAAGPHPAGATPLEGRVVVIPVRYGGDDGPDLNEVAALLGATPEEVVRRHTARPVPVAFFGFAPGFAYLGPVPDLAVPRRAAPRVRVPAGAVALAAGYTAVYPREGPGGWHLIGRTDIGVFDPFREPPAVFGPGDLVQFRPADDASDTAHRTRDVAPAGPPRRSPSDAAFIVEHPGVQSTVQDGRPRHGRAYGYPPSGALDRPALARANTRVGNDPRAAGLELLLGGLRLRALRRVVIALDGADLGWDVDGVEVPLGTAFAVEAGQVLRAARRRAGLRGYVAVRGGLAGAVVGGSASTDVRNGFGGYGRPLAAGDHLWTDAFGPVPGREAGTGLDPAALPPAAPPPVAADGAVLLDAVPLDALWEVSPKALAALAQATWRVGPHGDRSGLRLVPDAGAPAPGPAGEPATAPSQPAVAGLVQWPPDGGPIVLLRDHPTTGGYPRAAVLTSAALDSAAQLGPGQRVRFRWVPPGLAQARAAALETQLYGPWEG